MSGLPNDDKVACMSCIANTVYIVVDKLDVLPRYLVYLKVAVLKSEKSDGKYS